MPQPRIGLPLYGLASAAMDISDGLLQDVGHLARENNLGATLYAQDIPLSPAARLCGPQWLETCLTGGDDYEILFSVPAENEKQLLAHPQLHTVMGLVPVHRIGHLTDTPEKGVQVLDANIKPLLFQKGGWSHF